MQGTRAALLVSEASLRTPLRPSDSPSLVHLPVTGIGGIPTSRRGARTRVVDEEADDFGRGRSESGFGAW